MEHHSRFPHLYIIAQQHQPPTLTPTPLPIPPYKPYIVGTWQEMDVSKQPTGKSYTIEVTQPVDRGADRIPRIWMGIIVTDENGQTQSGAVVNRVDTENVVGYITLFFSDNSGGIYNDNNYFPGYHIILWNKQTSTRGWAWIKK